MYKQLFLKKYVKQKNGSFYKALHFLQFYILKKGIKYSSLKIQMSKVNYLT